MRHCESPDACKWPRCGCIEGLGAIQNAAGRDATQRGKPGSLVDDPSLSAAPDDPVKELADHVAFYADSWPVYEPGYVVSLATRLAEKEVARLRLPPDETLSDYPGCVFCMEAGTPVRPGEVCPKCGDRLPTKAMMDRLQTQATMDLMMKDLREDQWHRQAAVKNMKKAEQRVKELEGLLKEVVEDRDEANWSLGTDLVERIDAALTTAP